MPVPVEGAYYRIAGVPGQLFVGRRDDSKTPGRWILEPVPNQVYIEDGTTQIRLRGRNTGFLVADIVGPL